MHGPTTTQANVEEQRRRVQNALGESFQVLDLLGQGGFAEVWAATDLRLKRQVAVKVLRGDLVISAALSERFRREAEAVAKLRHPNIVPIYQVGEGAGLSFYVMPLIEGESLRHRMEQGPLPIAEAQRILAEVAGALSVAHRAGIVHRDIKPDNIMLEGEEARPVVMDFGIAKALTEGETGLTGTGMIVGTPHYMSPEQASGEKTVDSRSDIYSLGVVAYQMVAGQLPFEGDSAQEVLVKHISGKPKRLDAVRVDTPVELADAVMKCLRKAPAERWSTAGELAAAVRPTAPSLRPRAPSLLRRPVAAIRRRSVRMGLYVCVLVLAAGAATLSDPTWLRWAWSFWTGTAVPVHVPKSYAVGWPGEARSVMQGSIVGSALWSLDDTVLVVQAPLFAPYGYDGRAWRRLPYDAIPALFPPALFRRGLWVWRWRSDLRTSLLYEVGARGPILRDSVHYQVTSVWSDGSVMLLGTSDGSALRGGPGRWQHEPTGISSPITKFLGTQPRQIGLSPSHFDRNTSKLQDSVLTFNGLNWRQEDVRPDTSIATYYFDGATFSDGSTALVGAQCEVSGCNQPLVLTLGVSGVQWRHAVGQLPAGVLLTGVWGRSSKDFYVYGGERRRSCPPNGACLLHVTSDTAQAVEALRGNIVIGMASLRGSPYVLTASGALWTLREGSWGVVGEVPGSVLRGAAFTKNFPWDVVWSDQLMTLGPSESSRNPRLRTLLHVRKVAIGDDRAASREIVWVLSERGEIARIECPEMEVGISLDRYACRPALPVAPPDRRRILDIEIGPDNLLHVAGEQGLLAVRKGGAWDLQRLPGGNQGEDVVSLSLRQGRPGFALTKANLFRADSQGVFHLLQALPPPAIPGQKVVGVPNDSLSRVVAVVLGGQGAMMILGSARAASLTLEPPDMVGRAPSSLEVLADGRFVLGYATPDDPLLGGRLFVYGQVRRDSATCYREWAEIKLPPLMDVYGLASARDQVFVRTDVMSVQGPRDELLVVGNGWRALRFDASELPFFRGCASPTGPSAHAGGSTRP